jgi:DNA-binding MarR family transcriptional regulator
MPAAHETPVADSRDMTVVVGRELVRLAQVVVRLEENELNRAHRLSYRQMRILNHIHGGVRSISELADRFAVTPPAISETVESMVKKGLIERHFGVTQDRRSVLLGLTPAGERLYEETQASEDRLATEILSFIGPAQVKRLGDIVAKLVDQNQQRLFAERRRPNRKRKPAE